MILSSRPSNKAAPEFKAWLSPKPKAAQQFNEGLGAKHADKFTVDPSAGLATPESAGSSSEFTLWQPRRVDVELAPKSQDEISEPIGNVEEEQPAPEPAVYTQSQLQEYGENQFAQGLAQAREEEAAATGEIRARLETLIATLGEQRIDTSAFYQPLKHLLVKSVEAVLKAPLVESRAGVEEMLTALLRDIDQGSEGEAASVKLFLNPKDLAAVENSQMLISDKVKLLADSSLSQGSLRATMQESIVQDLTESRLAQVCDQLLAPFEIAADQSEEAPGNEHES